MLPNTLTFTTLFDFQNSTDQFFTLTDTTPYSDEGIALSDVAGIFKIEGPAGLIYENTDFGDPDIVGNVSLVFDTVAIPNDVDGNPVIGIYTITYQVRISGGAQPGDYSTDPIEYEFCSDYVKPTVALTLEADCDCATVTSTDVTSYAIKGVTPTITRVHKLFYPANLEFTNLTGSGVILQATYPNVYTGTYTGKITSTIRYTFSDGLMVQWIITGSDEIQNDCTLSQCTIYCGMKSLTNLFYQYESVGNFGQAKVVFDQLMQINILMANWINARECGKPADAAVWIAKIMEVGSFDENCGCNDNTSAPIQVIPFCGGSGGGNTIVVAGDGSFGTDVTAATVGSTTTYTVRLTNTYKNLILNALQSQDLSVTAFRAAGIPEEGRGVTTVSVPNGGGTLNLTVGVSDKVQVLLGSGTMTASYTVALPTGSFKDGDSFTIIYSGSKVLAGNNITIFGIALTDQEAASGNTQVYGVYDVGTTTWYVGITGRTVASAGQEGLAFWVNGADYALGNPVLRNTSPTYTYVCIQAAGSGSNPPATTAINNTWWAYVGNKSALYDGSDNVIIDTTNGTVKIIPDPVASTNVAVLTRETSGEVRSRSDIQTTALTTGSVWKGVGSLATPIAFNEAFSRAASISVPVSGTTDTNVASGGATITLVPGTSKEHQVFNGTVTLAASYTITISTPAGIVDGDHFVIVWKSICTTASNTVTIAGIALTAAEAFSGNVMVYAYYDLSAGAWKAYKITPNQMPVGTDTQTIRYNSTGTPVASSALTNDGTDISVTHALNVGTRSGSVGDKSQVIGTSNESSGANSSSIGDTNVNSGDNSEVIGNSNTNSGDSSFISGESNTNTGFSANVSGINNNNGGFGAHLEGSGHTNAAASYAHLEGTGAVNNAFAAHLEGDSPSTTANAAASHTGGRGAQSYLDTQMSRGSGNFNAQGDAQKSDIYLYKSTTNATIAQLFIGGVTLNAVIPSDRIWSIRAVVSAMQIGGSSGTYGDSSYFQFTGILKNLAGTVTLANAIVPTVVDQDAAASAWTVTVTADNAAKALKVQVTGEANKTINWFCHVEMFEVANI